jgi:hypothetical protein
VTRSIVGRLLVAFAIVALVGGSALAQRGNRGGGGGNTTNPKVKWDYDVVDENDKRVEKGTFLVRGYVLFNKNSRRIGSYEIVSQTHVKVTVTEGKLKGKLDLERETEESGTWTGELERGSGRKYKITVVFEGYGKKGNITPPR